MQSRIEFQELFSRIVMPWFSVSCRLPKQTYHKPTFLRRKAGMVCISRGTRLFYSQ